MSFWILPIYLKHWDISQRQHVTAQAVMFNSTCSTLSGMCRGLPPCLSSARGLVFVWKHGPGHVNSDSAWEDQAVFFLCAIIADGIVVIEWTRNVLGSKTKGISWENREWEGLGLIKNRTAMKSETGRDFFFLSSFLPAENVCFTFYPSCDDVIFSFTVTSHRPHPKITKYGQSLVSVTCHLVWM